MAKRPSKPKPSGGLSFVEAFDDPNLFGPHFEGPSWNGWRAVLKAAHAEALNDEELTFFRKVADRDPPKRRVRELWIVAGRRAGKDSIASALATHAALQPYSGLRPGEAPTIMCLACDKEQAKIVTRYSRGYFDGVPLLAGLIDQDTQDGFTLKNGAEFAVLANNFRSVRGRTVAFAILDECAFYRSSESVSPDFETYNALVPGMATLADSMLVAISSPHRRAGLLYSKWRDHYGKPDDDVLVIRAPSQLLNPTLPDRIVQSAMDRDPALAKAEYLAEWRDDLSTWLDRELIEANVDFGVTVRPPVPGIVYSAYADPSSGVGDDYTCAVGHLDDKGVSVLDCLVSVAPPFDPVRATEQIAATLRQYGVATVAGDRYAIGFVTSTFAACGVMYQPTEWDRSQVYAEALPLFSSGRFRLIENKVLINQLASLERRTLPGGKDRIDHPDRGHDDSANAACGVLASVATDRRPALVRLDELGAPPHLKPYQPPVRAAYVVAFVIAGDRGIGGVVYGAQDIAAPNPLTICDFSVGPMGPATFAGIVSRLKELGAQCRTSSIAIWCPEELVLFGELAGIDTHKIPPEFDAESRVLSVSAAANAGAVRVAALVMEKAKTSPLGGALDLRVGENVENPLRRAMVSLVSLCLDPAPSQPYVSPFAKAQWGFRRSA
jgi:hypothetical protein